MERELLSKVKKNSWRQLLFTITLLISTGLNSGILLKEISEGNRLRSQNPALGLGYKFAGLENIFKNESHIGYYTDKNLDDAKDAMDFANAQYRLAPVVLDLNNTRHKFILFDCSNPATALSKIKELGLIPFKINQFGIVLTKNPSQSR